MIIVILSPFQHANGERLIIFFQAAEPVQHHSMFRHYNSSFKDKHKTNTISAYIYSNP